MDGRGVSMDAAGQDVWDWEVLSSDHMSSSIMSRGTTNLADDQESKKPMITSPSSDAHAHDEPMDECKDIGAVLDETKPSKEEEAVLEVTDDPSASEGVGEEKAFQIPDNTKEVHDGKIDEEKASEGEEEKKTLQSPDTENSKARDGETDEEEEEEEDAITKDKGGARPDCVVFSVGKLKVNGIGALCSFGVAAATVCIFLIGGKLQHHHRQQQQKIQLQFYGDDKRIQQVVQQTSRLNQAMSSVMGGAAGAATRAANVSFGGFYDGF